MIALMAMVAAFGASPAAAVTKTVNGISVDVNLPQAQRGVDYSFQINPTGQTSPFTFQILSGALPAGFTMSSSGLVSGVNCSSTNGSYNVDVRITAANGQSADFLGNQGISINMTAGPGGACDLTVGPGTLANGTIGVAYSQQLTISGGTGPYTYAVASGYALPAGLTLSSTGQISGTPTTPGSYTFAIRANDTAVPGRAGIGSYTMTIVVAPVIVIAPSSLPGGINGTAYAQTVSASGGTAPYTYSISAGALPTGLGMSGAGIVSGTPSAAGTYNFTITATDSTNATGARAYSVTIGPGAVLTVAPVSLGGGTSGTAYSQTVTASGGTGSGFVFGLSSGTLPAGLSLNTSTGEISGNPSAAGSSSFTIGATDSAGNNGSRAYTLTIASPVVVVVSPGSLPGATNGSAYSQTVSASGGTGPYAYTISAGALPAGLTLNASSGVISGTPTTVENANFTVTATDSTNATGARAYSVAVAPGAVLTVGPSSLPAGSTSAAYAQTISASGGSGTGYSYSIASGALPGGLTLNPSSGVISGTPTTAGSFAFTVAASDSANNSGSRAYSVSVTSPVVVTITPASLPGGINGAAYSQTLNASGGTGPYAFAVASGSLPAGLSLSVGGVLGGTPSAAGNYSFTISATDADNVVGSRSYIIAIAPGRVLGVGPATVVAATNGAPYSQAIVASGGSGTGYVFAITSGVLPAGLTLDPAAGVVSGTPTTAGSYTFTVRATDSAGNDGVVTYTLVVAPRALIVGTANLAIDLSTSTSSMATIDLAQLVTSSDPGAGPISFEIVGQPANGTVQLVGSTLTYTSTGGSGNDSFQVVAIQNGVRSPPATIMVRVSRASLNVDPRLVPIATAQVDAAARAGIGQVENLASHLEAGMWDNDCALRSRVVVRNARGRNSEAAVREAASPAGQCRKAGPVKAWVAGSLTVDDEHGRVASDGLTLGAEARLVKSAVVGVALGTGRTRDALNATDRVTSSSTSISLYAGWRLRQALQLTGAAGYSSVAIATRRGLGATGRTAAMKRDGRTLFLYVGGAGDVAFGGAVLSPYLRASLFDTRLDAASEGASDPLAVRYGRVHQQRVEGTLGSTLRRPVPIGAALLTPFARIEHRWRSSDVARGSFGYADTQGGDVALETLARHNGAWSLGAGARLAIGPAQLSLEYSTSAQSLSSFDGGGLRAHLGLDF